MKNHYGVFIPECADYVGGYFDNSLRERMIHVAFDIRLSEWNEYHEDMNMEEVLLLLTNGETCSLVEQHRMQMRFVQQSLTVRTFPALVIMDMLAVIMPTFFFPSLL